MKVRIKIEAELSWGERGVHEVGVFDLSPTGATVADVGLNLTEG